MRVPSSAARRRRLASCVTVAALASECCSVFLTQTASLFFLDSSRLCRICQELPPISHSVEKHEIASSGSAVLSSQEIFLLHTLTLELHKVNYKSQCQIILVVQKLVLKLKCAMQRPTEFELFRLNCFVYMLNHQSIFRENPVWSNYRLIWLPQQSS